VRAGQADILSLSSQVNHHPFTSIAEADQQMIVEALGATHDDFPQLAPKLLIGQFHTGRAQKAQRMAFQTVPS
jgi:hypothetical protein